MLVAQPAQVRQPGPGAAGAVRADQQLRPPPVRVRELAGGNDPAPDGRTMQWSEARVLVARQLLARSGDDPELMAALQLAALVPLELDIMCDDATTPLGLVAHALAELAGPQV